MKITFVIYGLNSGGAERAVTGLANYWVKDHEISIITLVKTAPFYELDKNVNLFHCLEQPKTSTTVLKSLKDGALRILKLRKTLNRLQPDVVVSFMLTSNIYSICASRGLKIPSIICERSNHNVNSLPKIQEYFRNLSYPFCSSLIVQTEGNKNYYEKTVPKVQKWVIPNAIASELKLARQPVANSEKIILNVGSFKNGKAQDVLIRAFAQLPTSDWRLVFLGHGPNMDKFKNLAQQLGIADRVSFKGAQKDVASYYNKAAMFVFTSEHEGFPNALLEALYFGVPSISTNCPHGPSDMIADGENGFLVPVGDVNALAKKMQLLMNNPELRDKFSQGALESTKKYEMEPIAQQWMQVITSVTSKTN
ncbi:glycosyltransferase family 4 protein [Maribacter sp. MMG018]|uniref:glycosyltransferase family 4 protein n=1 Tax=Maribacter sp. MMG018 TaxID=2822688 RepID=UPI001B3771DF|nr:glycosyltransferase family 4 protein [Maribacter sp. MMG018]MBQ4915642.1 glycosyltransferase family 4 protein [Maribacter sp. MMG018]